MLLYMNKFNSSIKVSGLERKPDYEDILGIINHQFKVDIPKRPSINYYNSHFNLLYGSVSDERIKRMEQELLLQKFSKHYGIDITSVKAFTGAHNLIAVPSNASSFGSAHTSGSARQSSANSEDEEEVGTGGGGSGGGGGPAGSPLSSVASLGKGLFYSAGQVAQSLFGGGGGGSGGGGGGSGGGSASASPVLGFVSAPLSPSLLAGNPAQLQEEQVLNAPNEGLAEWYEMNRQEQEKLLIQQAQEMQQSQQASMSQYPEMAHLPTSSGAASSSGAAAAADPSDADVQEQIISREMFSIVGLSKNPQEYTDADLDVGAIEIISEAKAIADNHEDDDMIKAYAIALLAYLSGLQHKASPNAKQQFLSIVNSPEYKAYITSKKQSSYQLKKNEREAYKDNIVQAYNTEKKSVQKAMKQIGRFKKYLKDDSSAAEQPQPEPIRPKLLPAAPTPLTSAKYDSQTAPLPKAKPKAKTSGTTGGPT